MAITDDQREKCHVIIHSAAMAGAGIAATLAQIPGSDNLPLVATEVTMVIALGKVFGIDLKESAAKSFIAGSLGTLVGRGVSQFLFGWIPGLGNIIDATTAFGVIESLGWVVVDDFSNNASKYKNYAYTLDY